MANLRINDLPAEVTPTDSHQVPSENGSNSTVKLTVRQMLDIVKDEILSTVSASFNTLKKIEDGKLNVDGNNAMTGSLDMGNQTFANLAAFGVDIDMGANRVINLGYPGILVKDPTYIISSGTHNFNSLTKRAFVFLLGGGGAGGGSASAGTGFASAGCGGHSGSYLYKVIDVDSLTTKSATVGIGAGGIGSDGANGGDGGDSTWVDDLNSLTAFGGPGGPQNGSVTNIRAVTPAASVVPTTGDRNYASRAGGSCYFSGTGLNPSLCALSGAGGDSIWGSGGRELTFSGATSTSSNGQTALGFGSGGSGAYSIDVGADRMGGDGRLGLCIVYEYM